MKPFQPLKMNVVIYGGRGWVGLQMQKLLTERKVPFSLAKCKIGTNTEKEVNFNFYYLFYLRYLSIFNWKFVRNFFCVIKCIFIFEDLNANFLTLF